MDASLRAAVRERAGHRCEYCHRRQQDSPLIALHVEHIIPRKHGGGDKFENLALACAECNLHKGSNLTGIDPETKEVTRLFNPRSDQWTEHFVWNHLQIIGLTDIGRTTVCVLELNTAARLRVRLAARPD